MIRSRFSRLFRFPRRDALDLALGIKPSIPASSSLDHGDRHWRCVAVLGMEMGLDAGLDPLPFAVFGALHDRFRWNDHDDPEHGRRAAGQARAWGVTAALGALGPRMEMALDRHDKGLTSEDPFIGRCWDADRLTLPRVGITPRIAFMSSMEDGEALERWCRRARDIMADTPDWSAIVRMARGVPLADRAPEDGHDMQPG